MRIFVVVYCLLTLLFAGGCLVAVWPSDLRSDMIAQLLILSVVANAAFAGLTLMRAPLWLVLVCVVPYVALLCVVGWMIALAQVTFIVVALALLKGAVVMLGNWEPKP